MPAETTTSLGRYQILTEIGRGAMGVVYKARDPKIDRLVAIKAISLLGQEPEDDTEYRRRFFLEAQAAGRLSHPGIVTVFDVGEEPGHHDPYIVMEYVAGQSLSRVLHGQNKKLPLHAALQIAQELAEALAYAHSQGVVHRDIKPANIMVTMEGHAKIADFGIAKLNQAHMTLPGQVLGSPAYMAPEQVSGDGADARSDLFSLGVILYHMVTGFKPFQGNSATTVCFKVVNRDPLPASSYDADLPFQIDRIVGRAMAKDPAERYQTGTEMARDIQAFRQSDRSLQDATAFFKNVVQEQIGFSTLRPSSRNPSPLSGKGGSLAGAGFFDNMARNGRIGGPAAIFFSSLLPRKMLYGVCAVLLLLAGLIAYETARGRHLKSLQAAASIGLNSSASANSSSSISENAAKSIREQVNRAATPDPADGMEEAEQQQPLAKSAPALGRTALQLRVEHPFVDGEISIWMDNRLICSRPLVGEIKKKAIVFHQTEGHDSESLIVPAGAHHIHVRVQSAVAAYDQSRTVTGDFAAGGEKMLQVICDKHGDDLQITLK
jgi:serine/threonine protein kinase